MMMKPYTWYVHAAWLSGRSVPIIMYVTHIIRGEWQGTIRVRCLILRPWTTKDVEERKIEADYRLDMTIIPASWRELEFQSRDINMVRAHLALTYGIDLVITDEVKLGGL